MISGERGVSAASSICRHHRALPWTWSAFTARNLGVTAPNSTISIKLPYWLTRRTTASIHSL